MPRRNLTIILVAAAVSLLCYQRSARNRFAGALTEAMNLIATNYVSEVEPRVLFEGAMEGMVGKLDPYSGYTSPEELTAFQEQLDGEFVGVGIRFERDDATGHLDVVESLIGKPAYVAGIRAGDSIVAIDGHATSDLKLREAVRLIRGNAGDAVTLRVARAVDETTADFVVHRATIPLETVLGDARDADGQWIYRLASHPRIGYIRIFDNFGERTGEEFVEALASYRQPGQQIDGLIIDLRYNRGGLLEAAADVCDALLDEGTIVTTRGRGSRLLDEYKARAGTDLPRDVPVVVLVDRLSASASEIVAAALQDDGRAVVAGQRTWGKGSVQNVIELEGGKSAIRLTIGSYHRPSGKDIHKWKDAQETDDWGVRPDPGLEVIMTNHQNDLVILARRKRDFLTWSEVQPRPATDSSIPSPPPDDEMADASDAAAGLEKQAAAAASRDQTEIDTQLRKAVEYLENSTAIRPPPDKTELGHGAAVQLN
jgi:carboxyl-terminal processing protease